MRSSNHLALCHPCVTTTHLSYYSVLSLKLPPPFCAVLLAFKFFIVFQLRFKFYLQNLTWLCFVPFNRLKPSQLMSTVSQGSVARPFTFRFLGTAPFSVTVHMLRRNYESKHQLESQFADFDLDFVQLTCSNFTTFTVSRARPCQDMTSKILFDFRRATSLNSTIWDPPLSQAMLQWIRPTLCARSHRGIVWQQRSFCRVRSGTASKLCCNADCMDISMDI